MVPSVNWLGLAVTATQASSPFSDLNFDHDDLARYALLGVVLAHSGLTYVPLRKAAKGPQESGNTVRDCLKSVGAVGVSGYTCHLGRLLGPLRRGAPRHSPPFELN